MDQIAVIPYRFADFEAHPDTPALVAEYAEESAIPELGGANPQWEMYRRMEEMGAVRMLAAFRGEALVGCLVLIVSVVPHFGLTIASTESIFVARAARKTGAGLKLLHEAERLARESGAVGLFVSAPSGGQLAQVLDRLKSWRETNRVFFKRLP